MKFNLKKPCKDCPFRNDKEHQKGWLGGERAEEIYDGLVSGNVFPCHKTHDYTEDDGNGQFHHQKDHQFCAGALIMLEKTGEAMQSQAIRMAERFGFYNHKNLDMESAVFSSREDFIEWHEG